MQQISKCQETVILKDKCHESSACNYMKISTQNNQIAIKWKQFINNRFQAFPDFLCNHLK